jgi:endonuclease/exonuclease/phosphatase family metal-dependent hydrolase
VLKWCASVLCFGLLFAAPVRASDLRVVTFNTAMGVVAELRGKSGLRELFREHERLRRAQVLALQEVCLNQTEQLSLYLEIVKQAFGAQYHYSDYASTKHGQRCDKGQAIVSSLPITNAGTLQLPILGADRAAVWADLSVSGPGFDRVRVYSLHLSNRRGRNFVPAKARALQLKPVVEHALQLMSRAPGVPIVVAGDFNTLGHLTDPWQREPALLRMFEYFQASERSFNQTFLLPYQLDWIFYTNLRLVRGKVVGALYSDHFPVVADFAF